VLRRQQEVAIRSQQREIVPNAELGE